VKGEDVLYNSNQRWVTSRNKLPGEFIIYDPSILYIIFCSSNNSLLLVFGLPPLMQCSLLSSLLSSLSPLLSLLSSLCSPLSYSLFSPLSPLSSLLSPPSSPGLTVPLITSSSSSCGGVLSQTLLQVSASFS